MRFDLHTKRLYSVDSADPGHPAQPGVNDSTGRRALRLAASSLHWLALGQGFEPPTA